MKNQTEYVKHTFAPVYDSSSRVLLLGTMPSPKSRGRILLRASQKPVLESDGRGAG